MHTAMPALNGLRAFEAAARHLSMTRAAEELNVTPGALSHQIRGLEDFLGTKLFERKVRSIELTPAGRMLFPGLQAGFAQIRDAVSGLHGFNSDEILVVSTPTGFTAKWLAPRLYRFASDNPEIDTRVSSTLARANFTTDGVHIAVRNLPIGHAPEQGLVIERLLDVNLIAVCSPKLEASYGPLDDPETLSRLPLIHDETLARLVRMPDWADAFSAAGITHNSMDRGLRFNMPDHALDAAVEGAGMLLCHAILAYDDLRTGRLVSPMDISLPTGRCYNLVYPKLNADRANVLAFRAWVKQEIEASCSLPPTA